MRTAILALSLTLLSVCARATDVLVTTPAAGSQVTSPFTLNAASPTCAGVTTTAMGYSLDEGATTTLSAQSIVGSPVSASLGTHTLHVKCWGAGGAAASTAVPITVYQTNYNINALSIWSCHYDPATGAAASGTTSMAADGFTRDFSITYTHYGGELCYVTWDHDSTTHAYIYNADVMLDNPSAVANVELDMNQVTANGQTVIYGFQCDGWSGTWDYTKSTTGTASGATTWVHSAQSCPAPSTWGPGVWHHVQYGARRDDSGNVTYVYVQWDYGAVQSINQMVFSSFALGWSAGTQLTNYQVDGLLPGTGITANAHLKNLSIKRY